MRAWTAVKQLSYCDLLWGVADLSPKLGRIKMPDQIEETKQSDQTDETPEPAKEVVKPAEKTLTQSEVNKLMAKQRRDHEAEIAQLRADFDAFKKTVDDKETERQDAAKKQVEALRKDLPESIGKLLDKLTPTEQLEWLSDPANVVKKSSIPPLPDERPDHGRGPSPQVIV
jgi:predicted RNase H-like nuclease (RuvC/YqgF family)